MKCEPGCICGRHNNPNHMKPKLHPTGCKCNVHNNFWTKNNKQNQPCLPNCQCNKHSAPRKQPCRLDCICGLHFPSEERIIWLRTVFLGRSQSFESRLKTSIGLRDKNNGQYIDGSSLYRGSDWKWAQKQTIKRDNYTCQSCSATKPRQIQVHHIVKYKDCLDNRLTNIISLCSSCHQRVERGTLCLMLRQLEWLEWREQKPVSFERIKKPRKPREKKVNANQA